MSLSNIFSAGAVCAGVICAESIREQLNFKITKYKIYTSKMDPGERPKRIVFLSDLHNHEYGKNNIRLLHAVRSAEPDLILIGGDMPVGKPDRPLQPALHFVKQLPRIAPVYYAYGNHEQRMKDNTAKYGDVFRTYRRKLMNSGVHFLENESAVAELGRMQVRVTGLALPLETYEKLKKCRWGKEEIVRRVGESRNKDCYEILLAHNPVYYHAYKAWGADLVLSGHLHGGVVRIPGWRGVITPQACLFPKYSGEMTQEGDQTIVVSKGLGTHTINFRFLNKPELVLLEISGE